VNGFVGKLEQLVSVKLFTVGGTTVTPRTVVVALLILAVFALLSRLIQRAVQRAFRHRGVKAEGNVGAISRLIHYGVVLVGVGVALQTAGFDLTALFAAGAVFAVGIGFAMQNIAQNFVSGVILLAERAIKPNDVVEVGGRVVRVVKIGIRATIVRTRDGEHMIVPNSQLVQSTVKNYTLEDSIYRVRAKVGLVYGADIAVALETLEQVARAIEWRLAERDPIVLLTGFGDSSVDFDISVWIDDPWESARLLSQLNQAVWWALKEKGLTIAFPQLDVHFDPPVATGFEKLTAVSGG